MKIWNSLDAPQLILDVIDKQPYTLTTNYNKISTG